tara:strand:- start:10543 stop:10845 length:303 start_codon:yes stop_codon:yes gene_type:complete
MKDLLEKLKELFLKHLKGELVKLALKKLLGSATAGGIKGWLIKTTVEYLYDEFFVPLFLYAERKGLLYWDRRQGKIAYRRLEEAKDEHDEATYDDIIDNA